MKRERRCERITGTSAKRGEMLGMDSRTKTPMGEKRPSDGRGDDRLRLYFARYGAFRLIALSASWKETAHSGAGTRLTERAKWT